GGERGGMGEREGGGVSEEEGEGGREQGRDRDVVREKGVVARPDRRHAERRGEDDERPGHAPHHLSGRPRRPQGRTMSTAAMRANTAKIEKRGKNRIPNAST